MCLSASRYTSGGSSERHGSFNYVPGSGDDHEGWVPPGFGPEHYWANRREILDASREDLYSLMGKLANGKVSKSEKSEEEVSESLTAQIVWMAGTRIGYSFGSSTQESRDAYMVRLSATFASSEGLSVPQDPKKHLAYFTAHIGEVEQRIAEALPKDQKVQIVWDETPSSNERDIGIGIMLVALCMSTLNTANWSNVC